MSAEIAENIKTALLNNGLVVVCGSIGGIIGFLLYRFFFCQEQKPNYRWQPTTCAAVLAGPDWLSSDILNLRRFLGTETGAKLMQRGRSLEYSNAISGAKDQFHTVHSAGRTAGFSDALNWIDSCASEEMFSRVTGVQATKQNTSDSEQDDAALLEKFSP